MSAGREETLQLRARRALYYASRGWPVFVLGRDKTTLPNCPACRPENAGPEHDRERCGHLTCHGFYAATTEPDRIGRMLLAHDGMLAIRTGQPGRLLVIDAEATLDVGAGVTGLDVLDRWEEFTRDEAGSLPATLRQRTGGGGLHLVYRLPPGPAAGAEYRLASGRILPMVDVKADGGYVAVPDGAGPGGAGADGRRWLDHRDAVTEAPITLVMWLIGTKRRRGRSGGLNGVGGGGGGAPDGYSFREVHRLPRVPDGVREVYTRDLSYSLFRAGHDVDEVLAVLHRRWLTYDQPGVGGGARWYMPWEHVVAKVSRDRYTVTPEAPLDDSRAAWLERMARAGPTDVITVGRKTIVRRAATGTTDRTDARDGT